MCYEGYWLPPDKEICSSMVQASFNALIWRRIQELGYLIATTVRYFHLSKMDVFGGTLADAHRVVEGYWCDCSLSLIQLLVNFVLPEAPAEIRI